MPILEEVNESSDDIDLEATLVSLRVPEEYYHLEAETRTVSSKRFSAQMVTWTVQNNFNRGSTGLSSPSIVFGSSAGTTMRMVTSSLHDLRLSMVSIYFQTFLSKQLPEVRVGFRGVHPNVIYLTRPAGPEDALSTASSNLASGKARRELTQKILELDIKPLFLTSAHPRVNLESGRKLAKPAGGDSAAQDMFQDQAWKHQGQGCWNVIRWCITHLDVRDFLGF